MITPLDQHRLERLKLEPTFYDIAREEFLKEMGLKTGWGRTEVMAAFDRAFARAMVRYAQMKGIDIIS